VLSQQPQSNLSIKITSDDGRYNKDLSGHMLIAATSMSDQGETYLAGSLSIRELYHSMTKLMEATALTAFEQGVGFSEIEEDLLLIAMNAKRAALNKVIKDLSESDQSTADKIRTLFNGAEDTNEDEKETSST
jgi:hypothetical protein